MKFISLLLILIIMIGCIQSKQAKRIYIVQRDNPIKGHQLSNYTVFDSTGKKILYRLKSISTDIDTIILVNPSIRNITANLEGEWVEKTFNVTFSIPKSKSNEWTDGTIKDLSTAFRYKYSIQWGKKRVIMKNKMFSRTMRLYDEQNNELLAQFRRGSSWLGFAKVKYDLKIYSDDIPDGIHFFTLAIVDHRYQISIQQD